MGEDFGSQVISCQGGLVESEDVLRQGTELIGTATNLINMEPSLEGGYKRVLGYDKFDSNAVPGTGPILGVGVALSGVFAVRKVSTDNQIFYSTGSGWSAALNTAARTGSVSKARFLSFAFSEPAIIQTDGVNPAWYYNGTTDTLINGTGAPTAPKYALYFKGRVLLAPASNTSSVAISAPNAVTDFDGANGALEINVGDEVVGVASFRDIPYIFCKNSIFKLVGSTTADFQILEVSKNIGCVDGDTIQEVAGDLIFLAPDGFRSVAGTERIGDVELGLFSQQIQPSVRDLVTTYGAGKWCSVYVRKKNQYRALPLDTSAGDDDAEGLLGTYKDNGYEWAKLKGFPAYVADAAYDGTNECVVFGHYSDGYVYEMEEGNDRDGSAITFNYWTPHLTFGDAEIRKVFHEATMYFKGSGASDVNLDLILDLADPDVLQPATIPFTIDASSVVWGSFVWGASNWTAAAPNPKVKELLVGSGFTGQFRFSGSHTGKAPFRIDNMQIEVAAKGRR